MDGTDNDFMTMEAVTRFSETGVALVRDVATGILYARVEGNPPPRESVPEDVGFDK